MKKLAAVLFLSVLSASSFAADAKETVSAFHAALTAGDKVAAMKFLSPDVMIFESGYVERSRAEYASHHLGSDMAFAKSVVRKVLKQGEKTEGKMAIVWQETETTGMHNGKAVHSFGTETSVLEKNGDNWTIVHVHWSSRNKK
jgi:ketosteroid isomerase-like protein